MLAYAAVTKSSDASVSDPSATSFSHLDATGRAAMVDVSAKAVTRRVATASCRLLLAAETLGALHRLPKGDAYAVARLAGIQGAKRTGELIPLAHPLPLDQVDVELVPHAGGDGDGGEPPHVAITCRVVATARTGAEMEALTACATAALALYDMIKARDRGAVVTDLRLEAKEGGKSGRWVRGETAEGEGS
jgi:cyclic pyranopterin monophosphate synthase